MDACLQDKQGNTALHLAASFRQSSIVDLLLSQPSASSSHKRALATSANKAGLLPIHAAAVAGCSTCCSLCCRAVGKSSDMLAVKDKKGLTAGDWARKHGHQVGARQQAFTLVSPACAINLTAAFYLCSLPFSFSFEPEISTSHVGNAHLCLAVSSHAPRAMLKLKFQYTC